jgi:hypothetical protein
MVQCGEHLAHVSGPRLGSDGSRTASGSSCENQIYVGVSRMTRPTISGISPFFIVADVPAALSF